MTKINPCAEVSDRIAGRKEAEELLSLLLEDKSQPWKFGFFREINRQSIEFGIIPSPETTLRVMDEQEAATFEHKKIAFGTHESKYYLDVPITYLTWIADNSLELQAYLRSDRGRRRIEDGD